MKMETTFDHAWLSRELLEQIISKSGAGIRLPDLTISALDDQPKKNSIWIRGSMDAVYTASVLLNVKYHIVLLISFHRQHVL